jgi:hypothetical protein
LGIRYRLMFVSPSHLERPPHRHGRRRAPAIVALALAVLSVFIATPPAAAARAFSIGTGDVPDIAIDRSGSAHLAWVAGSGSVLYCGLIRGGEACGRPRTLYGSGLTAGRPHVLLAGSGRYGPGRLVVSLGDGPCPESQPGLCTYVRNSENDGVSFDPPRAVAAPDWPGPQLGPNTFGDAVFGPGNSISYASATSAVFFFNAPLGGGIERRFVQLAGPEGGGAGAVIGLAGTTPVVAYADLAEPQTLYWRAYRGPAGLDEAAAWTPPQPIESGVDVLEDDAIASGPAGLFVMYQRGAAHGVQRLVVRRFTGAGFGPATPIGEPLRAGADDYPVPADLTEDASGRLHAAWIDYRSHRLRAAASTAGGETWGRPFTIAAGRAVPAGERSVPRLDVAAAPDGLGYAVWVGGSGRGEAFRLRAAQLEPHGPHGSCRLPNCLILGGAARRASGNRRFELRTRVVSCAPRRLKVEAKVTIAPRRARLRARLRGVSMRLDGGGPRRAEGRPPTRFFSFPRNAHGGSHRLSARLALSVSSAHGRPQRRGLTLSQSFASCP